MNVFNFVFKKSYVTKNKDAPGADPNAATLNPLYIPLNPPLLKKPCDDCNLVLIVSNGYKLTSTVVPAIPPDSSDMRKGCNVEEGGDSVISQRDYGNGV